MEQLNVGTGVENLFRGYSAPQTAVVVDEVVRDRAVVGPQLRVGAQVDSAPAVLGPIIIDRHIV
jgi:hypothetical protein